MKNRGRERRTSRGIETPTPWGTTLEVRVVCLLLLLCSSASFTDYWTPGDLDILLTLTYLCEMFGKIYLCSTDHPTQGICPGRR